MAEGKPAKKSTPKPAARTTGARTRTEGFTAEEKAAMKDRVRELRTPRRSGADAETDVLAKIAEMPEKDRVMGERIHALIRAAAPSLVPRLWYGMPAYGGSDGSVVCFFRGAHKFKTRYATLGFSDKAKLDDGAMWPTDFAVKDLTAAEEARITDLVKKAVG